MTDGLKYRIDKSIALLQKAERIAKMYDPEDGFYLAFSGGKDSQALYHLAQMAGVKFRAHFLPTTIDPPQLIRFIRKNYPDVEFGKVKQSIYAMALKKGFLPTMRARWCCAEYKETGGTGKVTLIGIRHQESTRRAAKNEVEFHSRKFSGDFGQFEEYRDSFTSGKETEVRCMSGRDSLLISPIIEWTDRDVWEFLNDVVKVQHCELYDPPYNQHRIGCILCPMSSRKQKRRDCALFPHVKAKWIETIEELRRTKWADPRLASAEEDFEWWFSGLSLEEFMARRDTPELFGDYADFLNAQ